MFRRAYFWRRGRLLSESYGIASRIMGRQGGTRNFRYKVKKIHVFHCDVHIVHRIISPDIIYINK